MSLIFGAIGFYSAWINKHDDITIKDFLGMGGFVIFLIILFLATLDFGGPSTDCGDFNQGPCYTSYLTPHPGIFSLTNVILVFGIYLVGVFIGVTLAKRK